MSPFISLNSWNEPGAILQASEPEEIVAGGAGDWGPASALVYAPTVVKWNLMSGGEIKDTTIQVLWTHRLTGQRFPVYFGPGGSAEIKILLARR